MIANADSPGHNITVQPELAPQWLQKLASLQEDSLQNFLPNRRPEEFNLPEPRPPNTLRSWCFLAVGRRLPTAGLLLLMYQLMPPCC